MSLPKLVNDSISEGITPVKLLLERSAIFLISRVPNTIFKIMTQPASFGEPAISIGAVVEGCKDVALNYSRITVAVEMCDITRNPIKCFTLWH